MRLMIIVLAVVGLVRMAAGQEGLKRRFDQLDTNKDGVLTRNEVGNRFGDLDANGDGVATFDEVKTRFEGRFGVRGPRVGWRLNAAMARVAREPAGIIVILRRYESPRDLVDAVAALSGKPVDRAGPGVGEESRVLRTYGIGAQILRNLGVRKMRVLSAPKQMTGLSGFGLQVTEYVDD